MGVFAKGKTFSSGETGITFTVLNDMQDNMKFNAVAKGDILSASGAAVGVLLSVGATGEILGVSPATESGLIWTQNGTREFFVYPAMKNTGVTPFSASVGDFAVCSLGSTDEVIFNFKIPHNFQALSSAEVIVIPDTTETIQWDTEVDWGTGGEVYTTGSDSETNSTRAVTVNKITALDVSGSLTGITSEVYVGFEFLCDTSNIRIIGLRIRYS